MDCKMSWMSVLFYAMGESLGQSIASQFLSNMMRERKREPGEGITVYSCYNL